MAPPSLPQRLTDGGTACPSSAAGRSGAWPLRSSLSRLSYRRRCCYYYWIHPWTLPSLVLALALALARALILVLALVLAVILAFVLALVLALVFGRWRQQQRPARH